MNSSDDSNAQPRLGRRIFLFLLIFLSMGGTLFFTTVGAAPGIQATVTPAVTATFNPRRLDPPATQNPPRQIDKGAVHYWGACMSCHGDRGQGLNEDWLNSFNPEERDCWQSGCHLSDHPENSFEIPIESSVPGVAGAGKLARFANAFELKQYISEAMPWWNPGMIPDEEAWAVTAHLMNLHGTHSSGINLDKNNASAIPLHRKVFAPGRELPGALALAGVLGLAAVGMVLQAASKHGEEKNTSRKVTFIHHLHPARIPAAQARFGYTLGAGGLAIFFCLILFVTGLLEMYYYIPAPEQAAISVETITTLVPFGNLARNLHYWSAQALVITATIHLLRVVLTGAYAPPRRFNYLLGLGLLALILLLNFTGYVLRWDEGIRWALVVGTNLLKTIPLAGKPFYALVIGGTQPGAAALTRFYAWHIFGLTGAALLLVVWHIFRVRRDGGIAAPRTGKRVDSPQISRFALVRREILAMLIAGVILLLLSATLPAPIDQPISSTYLTTGDSRAPWFFLWVQQILIWGDPFVFGILVPVFVIIGLGLLPYLLPNVNQEDMGRWFPAGNRLAQALASAVILGILILTIIGAFSLQQQI